MEIVDMHGSTLRPSSQYAQELRDELPEEVFRRRPQRLFWLPAHFAIIAAAATGLLTVDGHWGLRLALSAIIGHSYGCLMFLAHEILHGTVVKNATLQNWLSGICMLPYCIGPAHWKAWHNRAHHGNTSISGADPDSFGNVPMFLSNRVVRYTLKFAPGSRHLRSWLFLGFWFSFHSLVTLFVHSKEYHYWNAARRRRQIALFFAEAAFWGSVLAAVGSYQFLFLYVLPMVVANMLQMSYISTNHLFCDETLDANDPLANSLSVTVPGWLSWVHLNFGYHVEHHIFPYMNPGFAPRVRDALESRYGSRYRTLPLWKALQILYRTPQVHLSRNELVDTATGAVFSTLGEHGELPRQIDVVPVPVRPRRRQPDLRVHNPDAEADRVGQSTTDRPDEESIKRAA